MTFAIFHDYPGLEYGLPKFHDFPGPVVSLNKFTAYRKLNKTKDINRSTTFLMCKYDAGI